MFLSLLKHSKYCIYQENTYCYAADREEIDKAHQNGLSYGKYRAYQQLQELEPEITPEDVQDMTMDEIRQEICQHTETDSTDTKGHHGNNDNGQGKHQHQNGK